jgi:hypothetical protein
MPAIASDVDALSDLLRDFLAGASVGSVSAHERFWADELIYTSSNGSRTNKIEIVEGMRSADSSDDNDDEAPTIMYTAEDIQVQIYGETAVVAFRLLGTPRDEVEIRQYFNTGTFLKRNGEWRAVAWQATRIPDTDTID